MKIFGIHEHASIGCRALVLALIWLPTAVTAQEKKNHTAAPPHTVHAPPVQQQHPVQRAAPPAGGQRNMPATASQTPRPNPQMNVPGTRPAGNPQQPANQRPPTVYQQPRPNPNVVAPVNPNGSRAPETFRPTNRPGGTYTPIPAMRHDGMNNSVRPVPHDFHGPNNTAAGFRSDGSTRFVRGNGISIVHGPSGTRHFIAERPDHTVIVANGAGHGYVQRPFAYRNVPLVNRTYYVRGTRFTRVYRPYSYRGVVLNAYVPTRYYA